MEEKCKRKVEKGKKKYRGEIFFKCSYILNFMETYFKEREKSGRFKSKMEKKC